MYVCMYVCMYVFFLNICMYLASNTQETCVSSSKVWIYNLNTSSLFLQRLSSSGCASSSYKVHCITDYIAGGTLQWSSYCSAGLSSSLVPALPYRPCTMPVVEYFFSTFWCYSHIHTLPWFKRIHQTSTLKLARIHTFVRTLYHSVMHKVDGDRSSCGQVRGNKAEKKRRALTTSVESKSYDEMLGALNEASQPTHTHILQPGQSIDSIYSSSKPHEVDLQDFQKSFPACYQLDIHTFTHRLTIHIRTPTYVLTYILILTH